MIAKYGIETNMPIKLGIYIIYAKKSMGVGYHMCYI